MSAQCRCTDAVDAEPSAVLTMRDIQYGKLIEPFMQENGSISEKTRGQSERLINTLCLANLLTPWGVDCYK